MFRVYASKDGKPSAYSSTNVPLKPKYFFPVSLKGFKDGDYAMIYGYPGATNRYETSYGIKLKVETENPALVALRDMRLKYMYAEMIKDPAVKLKLGSNYASFANYWKFFEGETKQLLKFHTMEAKQKAEGDFLKWANGKPEYENIFREYEKNYAIWGPYAKQRQYINEGILGSPLAAFASSLQQLEEVLVKTGKSFSDLKNILNVVTEKRKAFLAAEDKVSDEKILAASAMMFYNNNDKSQHPIGFYQDIKTRYGALSEESTYKAWAKNVFAGTMILNEEKWNAFILTPDANTLQSDPAFNYASAFVKNYALKYLKSYNDFLSKNNELGRAYLKGIKEMNPAMVKKMYPDANFSMRVTYGNVKSYNPRDGVHYDYFTTNKGILEKYVPGDYEFDYSSCTIH